LKKMVLKGAGRGEHLDLATRGEMERHVPGYDFSKVRVFRGPLAEEVTARHKADAVTIGNTGMILMRQSARSASGTTTGRALLAHELTHVAQAQRGMVFAKEGGASGEGAHEQEAHAVEHSVEHGGSPGGKGHEDKGAEIRQALNAVGVRAVLIKGPVHARLLYPDPALRAYTDAAERAFGAEVGLRLNRQNL